MMRPVPSLLLPLLVGSLLVPLGAANRLQAQEEHRAQLAAKYESRLQAISDGFDGVASIHAVDLTTGDRFGVNEDMVFPQGSSIKIPILLELFRRAEDEPGLLEKRLDMTDEVRTAGSGVLQFLTDGGSALSLEDYAVYMILYSDNTATNVLIRELGMDAINALSASLGAPSTLIQREMIRPDQSAIGNENLSTAREAALIMDRIASCDLPMSEASCVRVREILEIYKAGPVRTPVPRAVPVAFKPGGIEGVATVWALVGLPDRPYILTVMTNYGGDGSGVIEAASRVSFEYFSRLARSTPHGARVPLRYIRR